MFKLQKMSAPNKEEKEYSDSILLCRNKLFLNTRLQQRVVCSFSSELGYSGREVSPALHHGGFLDFQQPVGHHRPRESLHVRLHYIEGMAYHRRSRRQTKRHEEGQWIRQRHTEVFLNGTRDPRSIRLGLRIRLVGADQTRPFCEEEAA